MTRGRAERRHQRVRMIRRWTPLIRWSFGLRNPRRGEEQKYQDILDRIVHLHIKTRQLCSCPMCGNSRRTEGPTRQELLASLDMQEQLSDLAA